MNSSASCLAAAAGVAALPAACPARVAQTLHMRLISRALAAAPGFASRSSRCASSSSICSSVARRLSAASICSERPRKRGAVAFAHAGSSADDSAACSLAGRSCSLCTRSAFRASPGLHPSAGRAAALVAPSGYGCPPIATRCSSSAQPRPKGRRQSMRKRGGVLRCGSCNKIARAAIFVRFSCPAFRGCGEPSRGHEINVSD